MNQFAKIGEVFCVATGQKKTGADYTGPRHIPLGDLDYMLRRPFRMWDLQAWQKDLMKATALVGSYAIRSDLKQTVKWLRPDTRSVVRAAWQYTMGLDVRRGASPHCKVPVAAFTPNNAHKLFTQHLEGSNAPKSVTMFSLACARGDVGMVDRILNLDLAPHMTDSSFWVEKELTGLCRNASNFMKCETSFAMGVIAAASYGKMDVLERLYEEREDMTMLAMVAGIRAGNKEVVSAMMKYLPEIPAYCIGNNIEISHGRMTGIAGMMPADAIVESLGKVNPKGLSEPIANIAYRAAIANNVPSEVTKLGDALNFPGQKIREFLRESRSCAPTLYLETAVRSRLAIG